jgi:hypothetical protein
MPLPGLVADVKSSTPILHEVEVVVVAVAPELLRSVRYGCRASERGDFDDADVGTTAGRGWMMVRRR